MSLTQTKVTNTIEYIDQNHDQIEVLKVNDISCETEEDPVFVIDVPIESIITVYLLYYMRLDLSTQIKYQQHVDLTECMNEFIDLEKRS